MDVNIRINADSTCKKEQDPKERRKLILHEELEKQVNQLLMDRREANIAFDKSLQIVNSGAIAISFTYLIQIGIDLSALQLIFLILSWILLLVAIAISLFGQHKSCKLYDDTISKENLTYAEEIGEIKHEEKNRLNALIESTQKNHIILKKLNAVQLYLTVFGILFFGIFVMYTTIIGK